MKFWVVDTFPACDWLWAPSFCVKALFQISFHVTHSIYLLLPGSPMQLFPISLKHYPWHPNARVTLNNFHWHGIAGGGGRTCFRSVCPCSFFPVMSITLPLRRQGSQVISYIYRPLFNLDSHCSFYSSSVLLVYQHAVKRQTSLFSVHIIFVRFNPSGREFASL